MEKIIRKTVIANLINDHVFRDDFIFFDDSIHFAVFGGDDGGGLVFDISRSLTHLCFL